MRTEGKPLGLAAFAPVPADRHLGFNDMIWQESFGTIIAVKCLSSINKT